MTTILFSHGPIPADEVSIVETMLNGLKYDKIWLTGPYGARIVWEQQTVTYPDGKRKRTIRVPQLGYHAGKDVQPKGREKGKGLPIYAPISGKMFILPGNYANHNGICIWDSTNNIAVMLLHMDVVNPATELPYVAEFSDVVKGETILGRLDLVGGSKIHLHYAIGRCYTESDAKNGTFMSYESYLEGQKEWNRLYPSTIQYNPYQCHIGEAYEDFTKARRGVGPMQRLDPLALDLDDDGIETVRVKDFPTYFDYDGDWFAEQTGWVARDDGVLAMDRDGDGIISSGQELFGDRTILKDGTRARSGFQALAELDDNKDGRIDAADASFSKLRVWKGVEGNGASLPEELLTLAELRIKAINLDSTIVNVTDPQGNTEYSVGSFQKVDGTFGQVADYSFQLDPAYAYSK